MKLIAAIGLFFLSLVFAVIGVAERTVLAPPPSKTLSLTFEAGNPYLVIPNATLASYSGLPSVQVSGTNKVFIAVGRESDIRAWIGEASSSEIAVSKGSKKNKLELKSKFGNQGYANPRRSDLWRSEITAVKSAAIDVNPSDGAAALIASDGFGLSPNSVAITWPIRHDLTESNLLLISSAVLLLAEVPKAPQGPKTRRHKSQLVLPTKGRRVARKLSAAASGLIVLSLVAGCSASAPQAKPTPTATGDVIVADPPVVLPAQLNRILKNVAQVAATADSAKDKTLLESRFSGPAFDMRAIHYVLMSKSNKIEQLPAISATPVTWSLPAATAVWPRTIMTVTDTPGSELPQMLVLQQLTPRSDYKLFYFMNLVPGAKIPSVPVAEVGAIPVASDSVYLRVSPKDIPTTYGDVIDKGSSSLSAGIYDVTGDRYYQDVSALQKTQTQKLKTATIKFRHTLGSASVFALATTNGGALVAVYMKDTYTIKPKKAGSGVTVSGNEKLMLGANGSVRGVSSTYGNMMFFFVPSIADSQRAVLLGVTQGLLRVRGL
ncbi:MAG: hypothetical protein EBY26_04195 [Microbacteriaceae bacterium]|nr:hypothetical protein [Microbacteriaceae bacterium]